MSTTLNREAIINAVDTKTLKSNLPSYLSTTKRINLSTKGVEILLDEMFQEENTDVVELSDNVAEGILATADISQEYLAEESVNTDVSEYLHDYLDQGMDITPAIVGEFAVHAATEDITRLIAQSVRDAIEKTTGEDPCSWPNALEFPEED